MTDDEINDLSHELFSIVAASLSIHRSIEDTVTIMNDTIKEALKPISKK